MVLVIASMLGFFVVVEEVVFVRWPKENCVEGQIVGENSPFEFIRSESSSLDSVTG